MEIGKINKLTAARSNDLEYVLADSKNEEVILSRSEIEKELTVGSEIDVFIYKDLEDQIIATTTRPYAQLEQFAFLHTKSVNQHGAFMDIGLKMDLFVPFREHKTKMIEDNWYLVFILEDEETGRLIGSCRENEFVFYDEIDVKPGDKVDLLVYYTTDLGMNVIVNNLYKGLVFKSDIHKNIHPGDKIKGYVKQIREDGKLDISLEPLGYKNSIDKNTEIILAAIKENNGFLELTDKSNPDDIKFKLGLSKKAFKKGLGNLYRQKLIQLYKDGIKLL